MKHLPKTKPELSHTGNSDSAEWSCRRGGEEVEYERWFTLVRLGKKKRLSGSGSPPDSVQMMEQPDVLPSPLLSLSYPYLRLSFPYRRSEVVMVRTYIREKKN